MADSNEIMRRCRPIIVPFAALFSQEIDRVLR